MNEVATILPLPGRRRALFTCIASAAGSLKVAVILSNGPTYML